MTRYKKRSKKGRRQSRIEMRPQEVGVELERKEHDSGERRWHHVRVDREGRNSGKRGRERGVRAERERGGARSD